MTIYLKFASQSDAIAKLTAAGFTLSEYNDHCQSCTAWGSVFAIPEVDGHFANLYDCDERPESLSPYRVPDPATPYNVRWESCASSSD